MQYEQELREKTFKEEGLDIGRRVFYTLRQTPALQADANSKLLALLMQHLSARGHINAEELDTLLFETTR